MKKYVSFFSLILIVGVIVISGAPSVAADHATKEECVAKVKAAVKLIHEIGSDDAFQKISDRNGPYVWKDSYVFCVDNDQAKMLAHPFPRAIGMDFIHWKDDEGKEPFVDILAIAASKGKGWKSYMHQKPGASKSLLKTTYFEFDPESKIIVGAGYYTYE